MNLTEAEALLPWCIAGTLSPSETRLVQAFIDSGDISAARVGELSMLAETVGTIGESEPAYNPDILQRVMAQLDDVPQAIAEPNSEAATREVGGDKPGLFQIALEYLQWSLTPVWAKTAIGVQFALLFGVFFTFVDMDDTSTEQPYSVVAGQSEGDLRVMFRPDVSEAELRALLIVSEAEIIAGPGATGMYTLKLGEKADISAIQKVLADSPVTIYVQPVIQ